MYGREQEVSDERSGCRRAGPLAGAVPAGALKFAHTHTHLTIKKAIRSSPEAADSRRSSLVGQHVLAIWQALQVPHQQPDDPKWAINVKPVLVALGAHPFVGDALNVQQVAAVRTHFCYLYRNSRLLLVYTLLQNRGCSVLVCPHDVRSHLLEEQAGGLQHSVPL